MISSKKSTKKYHLVSSTSKMKRVSHQTPFSNVLQKHLKQTAQHSTNVGSTKHQNSNNIVHNNNNINNNNDIKKKEYPYTKTKSTLHTVDDNAKSRERNKTPSRKKDDINLSTGASMKNCFVRNKIKTQNEGGVVNSKRNENKESDCNSHNKSRDKVKTNELGMASGNNVSVDNKVALIFMKQGQNRETSARERRQLINNFYQNCNLIKSDLNILNNEIELSNESKREEEKNEKEIHDKNMLVNISNNDSNEKEEEKHFSKERTITKDNATTNIQANTNTNNNSNNTNNSNINCVVNHNNNTINTCNSSIHATSIKHAVTVNQHNTKRKQIKEAPKEKPSEENSEFFDYGDEKPIELSKEEKEIFGSREMKGYQKLKLLGKGGCGVVWLAIDKKTKREVAVKQVSKKISSSLFTAFAENNNYIAKNEIDILTTLNTNTKCEYIVEIYNSYEDNNDIWFAFEKGGKCLSSLSFKIKGEFLKTERIYSIKKGKFIQMLFSHINQFKLLIHYLLIAIDFINSKGIIHADIKPENILIEYTDESELNETNFSISKVKVIDFGSAFYADNPCSISSNTPEYLCPEITEILEGKSKKKKSFLNDLHKYTSCVDIWSLGVTLLELVLACPVWMSYKAKVVINGKVLFKTGLFGFKGRDGNKINNKQVEVSQNLHKLLNQSLIYSFEKEEKEMFEDLLSKMLKADYKSRITPQEALQHPFLRGVNSNDGNNNHNNDISNQDKKV